MPNTLQRGRGRFTTMFTSIPAGQVRVAGLPAGAAGSSRAGNALLSSIASIFAISPDTALLLPPAPVSIGLHPVKRLMPRRPASGSETEMGWAAD